VSGYIRDPSGAAVTGALVTLTVGRSVYSATTDPNGYFQIEKVAAANGRISVSADGFETYTSGWTTGPPLQIALYAAVMREQVTVTREDSTIGATPQSVAVLDRQQLSSNPAVTLDDKLRQVPGFTLFRRTGSRSANPTTQGVSLRGTGGSGASRAAVLIDDFPLNDPFGGWIYWGRIPTGSVGSIEVLRGSAGEVTGNASLGGVVNVTTRSSETHVFDLDVSLGSQDTSLASAFASNSFGKFTTSLGGEFFRTSGSVAVVDDQRGTVDTAAGNARSTFLPYVEYRLDKNDRIFARGEYFQERRTNGTPLQNNDTKIFSLRTGMDLATAVGSFALRGWLQSEIYHQSFSSISTDRDSELLTRLQTVPSGAGGASLQWTKNFSSKGNIFAGSEFRTVRGSSDELAFAGGRPTSIVNAGGRELTIGAFIGGTYLINAGLVLSAGARFDRWQEYSAYSDVRPLTSVVTSRGIFPDRSATAVSPRASVLFRVNKFVALTGSLSTGFRQPTLNELYRSFRVGNVVTQSNIFLTAEKALTAEGGVLISALGNRLYLRSVGFCTRVSDPVSNVTLSATTTLITRQRQNLGSTRSCGVETDSELRLPHGFDLTAGYLFVDSRVTSFPADRTLEGLRVPQVARNQMTLSARYSNPKSAMIAVQLRASGSQFDDDQNLFRLGGFAIVDLYAERRVSRNLNAYVAAENIFNKKVEAGRTPVLALSNQRTMRIGLRIHLGRK
jgi:outer membrane receptor protein involved in Fe transport